MVKKSSQLSLLSSSFSSTVSSKLGSLPHMKAALYKPQNKMKPTCQKHQADKPNKPSKIYAGAWPLPQRVKQENIRGGPRIFFMWWHNLTIKNIYFFFLHNISILIYWLVPGPYIKETHVRVRSTYILIKKNTRILAEKQQIWQQWDPNLGLLYIGRSIYNLSH